MTMKILEETTKIKQSTIVSGCVLLYVLFHSPIFAFSVNQSYS